MAGALAYQAWSTWVQPRVKAIGMSREKADEIEAKGGTPPMERVIAGYLKRMNITVAPG
jgi:hypothetical protein